MPPMLQYLSIGYGMGTLRVSIYLSPFPARNIEYGICPLRVSIFLSAPAAADIAPRPRLSILLSNPEILISYASVSVHSLLHPQI